jgi:hypothetical protein
MSRCFSGEIVTLPASMLIGVSSAYCGTRSMPSGAFPGLSKWCAGFMASYQ